MAVSAGSLGGLVFGVSSLNRPVLNAAVFYLVGAVAGALVACLAMAALELRRRTADPRRLPDDHLPHPTGPTPRRTELR